MPIDPRIALGSQPPAMESPINMMATMQQLQAAKQSNALRQAQMENYASEVARRNALLPSELDEAKHKTEREQTAAQAAYAKQQRDILATINDPKTYGAWRSSYIAAQPWIEPYLDPAEQFTPDVKQRLLSTADDALKRLSPELTFRDTAAGVQGLNPYTGEPVGKPLPSPPKAPGTTVNVAAYTPASEEAQKEFMKSTRATYDMLKQTPATLENMAKARSLVPQAKEFMGPGGEPFLKTASFLNNRLGMNIKTEGVKNATELRSVLFSGVLDNLRKLDAQPTAGQQNILQEALGSIGTDPNALPNVLDAYEDILRNKVTLHNAEVQSAIDRGVKFPYSPIINLPPSRDKTTDARKSAPTVVRTGTNKDGRRVEELSDGTVRFK